MDGLPDMEGAEKSLRNSLSCQKRSKISLFCGFAELRMAVKSLEKGSSDMQESFKVLWNRRAEMTMAYKLPFDGEKLVLSLFKLKMLNLIK